MFLELFAIIVIVMAVWSRLRREFLGGLCLAVVFLVCMPTYLRITLPQPFPALTIHRLLLLVLLWFWLREESFKRDVGSVAMKKPFLFWAGASGLSLLFTEISFLTSLKDYLDFVFEIVLFVLVIGTTVRTPSSAVRLLHAVWLGFLIIAIFAVIEKYTRFNPVDRFISSYTREKGFSDVMSTLPHRILLGTAMAMSWPIAYSLTLVQMERLNMSRRALWFSALLFLSACYFSMSRGPWLAAALAGGVLAIFGSSLIRKRMLVVCALAALVMVARPGVLGTFTGMAEATADVDSVKGGNFQYRIELWKVAWNEVSKTPLRALVGCGLGAGREDQLHYELSYRNKEYAIESWDNHFAYNLYQSGLLGLFASLLLYGGAVFVQFRFWRRALAEEQDFLACLLASTLVMLFMMTNVMIFAKQLNFAFWSIFAAGVAYSRYYEHTARESLNSETAQANHSDGGEQRPLPACQT
jgi:hypothetical protein